MALDHALEVDRAGEGSESSKASELLLVGTGLSRPLSPPGLRGAARKMPKHIDNKHAAPRKPYTKPARDGPPSSSSHPGRPPRPFDRDSTNDEPRARRAGLPDRAKPPPKAKPQPAQLDLSGQHLASPPAPADLASVAKLNLSNCSLSSIAFAKHAAASLTWLNVSGNALADPAAWAGVDQLQTLFGASVPSNLLRP